MAENCSNVGTFIASLDKARPVLVMVHIHMHDASQTAVNL